MKKENWFLLALLIYFVVNITGLSVPIVINAAKYAQVGREILDNNDWINLTIGGDAYDQKPPLLFWIAALVFKVFGISIIIYKATVLLVSFAGIYGTFKLAELLYDKKTGLLAAFFWATSLGFIYYHIDIHTDTLLVVPVILAIWQFAAFYKNHRNYHFYLGAVFVGLGMLAKGPVTIVIVGAAVGLHLLLTRNYKAIFSYRWLIGLLIVFIFMLPALLGLYAQFGVDGIKFYFWTNNFGRINGSYAGKNNDLFFYIHTTLYMIAPWAVFAFAGIFMQIREKWQRRMKFDSIDEFYTIGAVVVFMLISSVAKAKNPHYEMVVLPLISIIAARWTFHIFDKPEFAKLRRVFGTIHLVSGALLFLLSAVFLIYIFPETNLWIWLPVIAMAGLAVYTLTWEAGLKKQLAYLFIASSAFLFTLNTNVLANLSTYQSSFEACEVFDEQAKANEKLHIFTQEARYWEIFLYSKNYGRYMVTSEDFKRVNPPANDWLYTGPEGLKNLAEMKVPVDTIRVLRHNSMTRLPIKFLNPKTRESRLKIRYLLKIRKK